MKAPFSYYMHDGPTAFTIELAGILATEAAKELEEDWRSASEVIDKKALVVDVTFVREIDPEGRRLLLRWLENGAVIRANTLESRKLAESTMGCPLPSVARIPYAARPYRSRSFFRDLLLIVGLLALLVLLTPVSASAQRIPIVQTTNESIAFARYVAWLHARDPFTESGPVALEIVASLPGLNKQGRLLAIRKVGESEHSEYGIVDLQGDSIVFERVITPYLVAQRQAEELPLSSVLVTPRNYKFRYAGAVDTGDSAAYIFRITPKKSRAGLIRGELWIDAVTGAPVLVTGRLVKTRSTSTRGINVVREITFVEGQPFARLTHMMIETRSLGHAELRIIESPLYGNPASNGGPMATPQTSSVREESTSNSTRRP